MARHFVILTIIVYEIQLLERAIDQRILFGEQAFRVGESRKIVLLDQRSCAYAKKSANFKLRTRIKQI